MNTNENQNANTEMNRHMYRLSKGKVIDGGYIYHRFEVTSGYIHITDPAYAYDPISKGYREDLNGWFGRFDVPAENGNWFGRVTTKTFVRDGSITTRNVELVAFNTVRGVNALFHDRHVRTEFFNGVDTGQMGIFDSSVFPVDPTRSLKRGFYSECCKHVLSDLGCGAVRDQGIVTSSGFGDGAYQSIVTFGPLNRAIGVRIFFKLKIDGLDEE